MSEREAMVAEGTVQVREAAKFTGIGRTVLFAMMKRGELPFTMVHGRRLIPRTALRTLLASNLKNVPQA